LTTLSEDSHAPGSIWGPVQKNLPQKEIRLSAETYMVGEIELVPTRIATLDPKSSAKIAFALNQGNLALHNIILISKNLGGKRLELLTPSV